VLNELLDYYDYYVSEAAESASSVVTWCLYRGHPDSAWAVMSCASRESAINHAFSMADMCRAAGRPALVWLRDTQAAQWRLLPVLEAKKAA
jgi:hypothetical protein